MQTNRWQVVPFGWTIRPDGSVRADMPQGALLLQVGFCGSGELSATVVVHRAVTAPTGWKTVGITLWQDDRHHWRLNLVEAPENLQHHHTAELQEMYAGVWLAGNQRDTRLTVKESFSLPDWKWEYNKPYRLRLFWNAQSIRGEVYDGETLCWANEWLLDNPKAVRAGYLGLTGNLFEATFSQVETRNLVEAEPPQPEVKQKPSYRVERAGKKVAEPTGFFRVQQVEGAWWFIDPEGRLFFALGTDHTSYFVHWCEKLGYAPYHENMKKQHGTEEAWARETIQRLKSWNFNILAANHSHYLRYQGLPHIENILAMGQGYAAIDPLVNQVYWTGFPNVFSPRWQQWCEWIAYQRCTPLRDDPWLVGYFLDNELEWFGKEHKQWGLASEALKRAPGHESRLALAQLLRERYGGDVQSFNRAWDAQIADFDEIAQSEQPPDIRTRAAEQDGIAFTRLAAELYFRTCAEAIRKHDPNHLILGCRFAGEAPPILDVAGKYCDVVSINTYPRIDLRVGRVLDWEERLREYHRQSKRPLMITEWSFPALDSGLPCKHGAGMRVDTQQQRAECFRIFQSALFRLPFMVGSNFFMWVDEPALGISSTFPEDSNYGLVDERGQPYKNLVQTATQLQAKVYTLHTESARYWQKSPQPSSLPIPVFARQRWKIPSATGLAWQVDLFHTGKQTFSGWAGIDLPAHPMVQRLSGEWRCIGADGKPVPFHIEPLSRQRLWVKVKGLGPAKMWSGLVLFLPSSSRRRAPDTPLAGNFRLAKGVYDLKFGYERAPIRNILWQGQRIGSYTVLVQQALAQMQWVPPNRHEGVQLVTTPFGCYLRGWLIHQDGSAITEVNQQTGAYATQQARPQSYRVDWEMEIREDLPKPLLLVRMRRLQNLSKNPLRVEAVYHYAQSQLVDDGRSDEPSGVPNYYLNAGAWSHPQVGLFYGAMPFESEKWRCTFWKDPSDGQHPDLWHDVKEEVKPGETIDLEGGWVALLIGRGDFGKGDWSSLTAQVQSLASVVGSVQWVRRG